MNSSIRDFKPIIREGSWTLQQLGLSGAQAEIAISLALSGKPDGWLDKDLVKIRTSLENGEQ